MDTSKQPQHQSGAKDYYYILGVSPDASPQQIQSAYQELYDKYGPHVTYTSQDSDAMVKLYKDITEAWDTLGNPQKRAEYDQAQMPLLQKSHLRNLWGKLTGAKTGEEPKLKDELPETHTVVEISLREAVKGARKQIKVEDFKPCEACISKKPVDRIKCLQCHGSGQVKADRVEIIEIAKGTFDKQEIKLAGKGRYDARLRRHADLVVEVQFQQHPFFSVHGKDVSCTVPVNLYEAILGAEIEAPTPSGKVMMKIQPLTQRGRVYRLKGLGLGGGDLLLSIEVMIPAQLHADEVELFRKLHHVSSQPNPRAELFGKLQAYNQAQQGPNPDQK